MIQHKPSIYVCNNVRKLRYSLKPLDKEALLLINKLGRARWSEIKRNLTEKTKQEHNESIDTYLTRSLKRLTRDGYIEKTTLGSYPRKRYWLTSVGNLVAYKLMNGLRVDDPIRDQVLAFGLTLQWLKNMAIIEAKEDDVREYFKLYRKAIMDLDIDKVIDDVKNRESRLTDETDPWNDKDFIM